MGFGTTTIATGGFGAMATADGSPEYKTGGITVDWATVPANAGGATLADGTVIPAGVKFIPFGTILTVITASGKYGPYEVAAGDGRQTLARGRSVILNKTILATDLHADNPPGAMYGGRVFRGRIKLLLAGVYTATWNTTIETAFPRLVPVEI